MVSVHKIHEISSEMEATFAFPYVHYVVATQSKPEHRELNGIPAI